MIKANMGRITIQGPAVEIRADLSGIISALTDDDIGFSRDDIMASVEMGMKTEDEVKEMAEKAVADFLKNIFHHNNDDTDDEPDVDRDGAGGNEGR